MACNSDSKFIKGSQAEGALSSVLKLNMYYFIVFIGSFYVYVVLSDPGCIKFSHILEQCPRDWETTMRPNVVLTIFHTQSICHGAWKIVRTTL